MNEGSRFRAFGPFVLDTRRRMLWQDGVPVVVTPRVFDLLDALVERPGELLGKDELIKRVWAGTVVEENNLARQICTLRKILHERPDHHDYIVTVAGAGYRFVADVRNADGLPRSGASIEHVPQSDAAAVTTAPAHAADPLVQQIGADATDAAADHHPAAPPQTFRRFSYVAAGIAGLSLGLAGWYWAMRPAQAAITQRSLRQFTYGSAVQRDPAWSPTGDRLAFVSDRSGNRDIWVQGINDPQPVPITMSAESESEPAWSPDARWLAFRSERDGGGIFVVPAAGGDARRLTDFGVRPQWSPSGSQVLFFSAEPDTAGALRLYVVDASGGVPRVLRPDILSRATLISAAWHPNGGVSIWARDNNFDPLFVTTSVDGATVVNSRIDRQLILALNAADLSLWEFAWAPSSKFLYFEGRSKSVRNIWRVKTDPVTLNWIDAPERLTTGTGADERLVVSADGSRLAFTSSSGESGLWSFPFDSAAGRITGPGEAMTAGDPDESGGATSRDGRKVVYLSARSDRQEMWEREPGAGAQLLMSVTDWRHTPPTWSPDGTRLAYQRTRTTEKRSERAVVVMAVDTRREQVLTTSSERELIPADWSSDGRRLLAACKLAATDRVGTCTVPVGESGVEPSVARLWTDPGRSMFQQRYSPNQQWISFIGVPAADRSFATVYVMPAAGGTWTAITDGASYDDKPRWAPDGKTLYFISNRDGRPNVWGRRVDPATGEPQGAIFRVTRFGEDTHMLSPSISQMTMGVSSNRIILPIYHASSQIWVLDNVDR